MNFKLINPLEDFLNDLFKIHNEIGFPKFFYTSRANVVIVLFVAKSDLIKAEVGFEDICNVVPKSITSRSTIKSILDEATLKNYFIKTNSKRDKRKKIFKPSSEVTNFMKKWIQRNREIFRIY